MVTPALNQLRALLGAYGYNLYDQKNRARADDLLVREKAAEALAEGASALRALRTTYHRRFIPPLSRENPSPPPERLAALREMARLQERLEDLETRIRSMAVPTRDQVWERFRREKALLQQLLLFDYNLIAPSQELRTQAQAILPGDWDAVAPDLERAIDQIERATRERAEFMRLPGA